MSKANAAKARLKLLRSGHDTVTRPASTVVQPLPGLHDLTTALYRVVTPFVYMELRDNKVDLGPVQEVLSPYLDSYTVADTVLLMNAIETRYEYDHESDLYGPPAGPYGFHIVLAALGEFVANAPATGLDCALARATFSMQNLTWAHTSETLKQARYMCRQDLFAVSSNKFYGGRFGDRRWLSPGPGERNTEDEDLRDTSNAVN